MIKSHTSLFVYYGKEFSKNNMPLNYLFFSSRYFNLFYQHLSFKILENYEYPETNCN